MLRSVVIKSYRHSPRQYFRSKWNLRRNVPKVTEDEDILSLNKSIDLFSSLEHLPISSMHPIHQVRITLLSEMKYILQHQIVQTDFRMSIQAIEKCIEKLVTPFVNDIDNYLEQRENKSDNQTKLMNCQAGIRIYNFKHYLASLRVELNEGDISIQNLDSETLRRITDCFLLGSASERVAGSLS